MNKKAIAVGVIKHPLIKKLIEMNITSPSIINRLIVKELLKEADGVSRFKRALKTIALTAPSQAIIDASKDPRSDEGEIITADEELAIKISKTISGGLDSLKTVAEETINAELTPENMKAAVTTFEAMVKGMTEFVNNNKLNEAEADVLKQITFYAEQFRKILESPTIAETGKTAEYFKSELSSFLTYYKERSETTADDIVQAMNAGGEDEQETEPEESATETLKNAATRAETQDEIASNAKTKEEVETAVNKTVDDAKEEGTDPEKAEAAGEKAKEEIIDKMADSDDEDDNVPKEEFANLFEKENGEGVPSLADAFDYFSDKFISTKYMEEQRKAFNDVLTALAAFRKGISGLGQASLREPETTTTVTEAEEPVEEITPEETSELKQKQQEMIQALKNMAALIKAGDKEEDLFSKSRKDRIRKEAEALQILLMDVNALLIIETAPPPPEPQSLQEASRAEKIANIKAVYAKVNPAMLKVDEIVRNFKNPKEDANVSVSQINKVLDSIEAELKKIQPYFGKRQTAFTKDKMSYKNLAGMVKRFAKQLALIITEMNGAMEDGKITFEGSRSLAEKMKEISEDIEKYIGAPSRLNTKDATDVELDDDEEEETEKKNQTPLELAKFNQIFSDNVIGKIKESVNNDSQLGSEKDITAEDIKSMVAFHLYFLSLKNGEELNEDLGQTMASLKMSYKTFDFPSVEEYKEALKELNMMPMKDHHEKVKAAIESTPKKFKAAMIEIGTIYRRDIKLKSLFVPKEFNFKKAFLGNSKEEEEVSEDSIDVFMALASLEEKEKEVLKDFFDSLSNPETKAELGLEEQITREILRILRESKGILKEANDYPLKHFVDKYGDVNKLDLESKKQLISALNKLKTADETKFNTYFGKYASEATEEPAETKEQTPIEQKVKQVVAVETELIEKEEATEKAKEEVAQKVEQEITKGRELSQEPSTVLKAMIADEVDKALDSDQESVNPNSIQGVLAKIKKEESQMKAMDDYLGAYSKDDKIANATDGGKLYNLIFKYLVAKQSGLRTTGQGEEWYETEGARINQLFQTLKEQFEKVFAGYTLFVPKLFDISEYYAEATDEVAIAHKLTAHSDNFLNTAVRIITPGIKSGNEILKKAQIYNA